MKRKYDIEVNDSDKIAGGYLTTTAPLTKRQIVIFMTRLGRELIRNNRHIDRVSYTAWEADSKSVVYAEHVSVILVRSGRGVRVTPIIINKMENVTISLTNRQYRLLQQSISVAQIHPDCSVTARNEFANLGWDIHKQVKQI